MKQSIKLIQDALASAKLEEASIQFGIEADRANGYTNIDTLCERCQRQAKLILLIDDYQKGLDALKIGQINRMTGML